MKRRLDLGLALVHRPRLLFLDEPTTGLDPQSRAALWDEVRRLASDGVTVFLTTQYLEEADVLAHRVGIIDRGRIVAEGTPARAEGRDRATRASKRSRRTRAIASAWPRSCSRFGEEAAATSPNGGRRAAARGRERSRRDRAHARRRGHRDRRLAAARADARRRVPRQDRALAGGRGRRRQARGDGEDEPTASAARGSRT